jgi:hypothetical protein
MRGRPVLVLVLSLLALAYVVIELGALSTTLLNLNSSSGQHPLIIGIAIAGLCVPVLLAVVRRSGRSWRSALFAGGSLAAVFDLLVLAAVLVFGLNANVPAPF